jgi:transcriptional repressor NrdR
VVDSRPSEDGDVIRRRRECERCARRFTTYERLEVILPLVVKRDGRREAFDRKKIVDGLALACHKRPIPAERIAVLVHEVERAVVESGESEVPSTLIGERVMERLRELDAVAYVRFASVYRQFRDAEEFLGEVRQLLDRRP